MLGLNAYIRPLLKLYFRDVWYPERASLSNETMPPEYAVQ
ncbi:MAG: hypothetical protein RLZZ499_2436, partial [Cyanobacteriota bacterium]